ncbi:unnamed protein product [Ixodes persulcatus]
MHPQPAYSPQPSETAQNCLIVKYHLQQLSGATTDCSYSITQEMPLLHFLKGFACIGHTYHTCFYFEVFPKLFLRVVAGSTDMPSRCIIPFRGMLRIANQTGFARSPTFFSRQTLPARERVSQVADRDASITQIPAPLRFR